MDFQEAKTNTCQDSQQYPIQFIPQPMNQIDHESLIHEAKNFNELYKQFQSQPFFTKPYYYILSSKWLRRWKTYVSYQQAISAAPLQKFFGCGDLPKINQDIVDSSLDFTACFQEQNTHYNISLKNGLQEQKDYIFISEEIWDLFKKYGNFQVKRFVMQAHQGKKVQLNYQTINLMPIFSEFLKDVQRQRAHKMMHVKLQVSHYITVEQLWKLIKSKLKDFVSANYSVTFDYQTPIRFWLMPQGLLPSIFVNNLYNGCKANPSFSYKLYCEGQFMEDDKKICDFDIFQNSYIMAQLKQFKQKWIFFNNKKPFHGPCSNCRSQQVLQFVCSCKYALYCSKSCKSKDKSHHRFRCPNDCESQQEEVELTYNENSRRGLVGLRNLGNTCFMNSGLQCLSHIQPLVEYFLSNSYQKDINKENPLGTKGQLSVAFAKLLRNLWMGTQSSFSPTVIKRAIGKYQPMFMGYNQHDSGELVSYLLDGLHEDLNRVKVKPYVQTKDYDGSQDHIFAKRSWEDYLKRNQSIIVDQMFGQFKSIVDCPKCQYESIQFDPFLMCTLPIVNDNVKKLDVIYLKDHLYMTSVTVCYQSTWNWTIQNIYQEVKKQVSLSSQAKLVAYVTSYSTCEAIQPKTLAQQIRQQHKYRHLYVRQLIEGEDIKHGVKISLANVICHSYYGNQSYRKNITPYRLYYFNRSQTLAEIHHKIYSYYKKLYPIQKYKEEVIEVQEKEQPFRVLLIPASKYSTCQYCKTKNCEGCKMPYDQQKTLNDILKDETKSVQIELYWRKNDKQIQKTLDEIKQDDSDSKKKVNKKSGTTIHECFKLFQEPQTLAQDNAWYCPKCKDFVLAKKQMQIYKAPRILTLCLKRFKRKQYYQEKYNIMVDFPLQGFDLSPYVLNKQLPQEYFTDMKDQNIDQQPLLYDLIGITNHFGGTGGGHYTAYCLDPISKKWYDFDDSCVQQLKSAEDAVTQSAYMLYYRRRI